jgi:hypothetical protein
MTVSQYIAPDAARFILHKAAANWMRSGRAEQAAQERQRERVRVQEVQREADHAASVAQHKAAQKKLAEERAAKKEARKKEIEAAKKKKEDAKTEAEKKAEEKDKAEKLKKKGETVRDVLLALQKQTLGSGKKRKARSRESKSDNSAMLRERLRRLKDKREPRPLTRHEQEAKSKSHSLDIKKREESTPPSLSSVMSRLYAGQGSSSVPTSMAGVSDYLAKYAKDTSNIEQMNRLEAKILELEKQRDAANSEDPAARKQDHETIDKILKAMKEGDMAKVHEIEQAYRAEGIGAAIDEMGRQGIPIPERFKVKKEYETEEEYRTKKKQEKNKQLQEAFKRAKEQYEHDEIKTYKNRSNGQFFQIEVNPMTGEVIRHDPDKKQTILQFSTKGKEEEKPEPVKEPVEKVAKPRKYRAPVWDIAENYYKDVRQKVKDFYDGDVDFWDRARAWEAEKEAGEKRALELRARIDRGQQLTPDDDRWYENYRNGFGRGYLGYSLAGIPHDSVSWEQQERLSPFSRMAYNDREENVESWNFKDSMEKYKAQLRKTSLRKLEPDEKKFHRQFQSARDTFRSGEERAEKLAKKRDSGETFSGDDEAWMSQWESDTLEGHRNKRLIDLEELMQKPKEKLTEFERRVVEQAEVEEEEEEEPEPGPDVDEEENKRLVEQQREYAQFLREKKVLDADENRFLNEYDGRQRDEEEEDKWVPEEHLGQDWTVGRPPTWKPDDYSHERASRPAVVMKPTDEIQMYHTLVREGVPPVDISKIYEQINHGDKIPEPLWQKLGNSYFPREYMPIGGRGAKGNNQFEITPEWVATRKTSSVDGKEHWHPISRYDLTKHALGLGDDEQTFDALIARQKELHERPSIGYEVPQDVAKIKNEDEIKQVRRLLRIKGDDPEAARQLEAIKRHRDELKSRIPNIKQETKPTGIISRALDLVHGEIPPSVRLDSALTGLQMGLKNFKRGEHVQEVVDDDDGLGGVAIGNWGSKEWFPKVQNYKLAKAGQLVGAGADKVRRIVEWGSDLEPWQRTMLLRFGHNVLNKKMGVWNGLKRVFQDTLEEEEDTRSKEKKIKDNTLDGDVIDSQGDLNRTIDENDPMSRLGTGLISGGTTVGGLLASSGFPHVGLIVGGTALLVGGAMKYKNDIMRWAKGTAKNPTEAKPPPKPEPSAPPEDWDTYQDMVKAYAQDKKNKPVPTPTPTPKPTLAPKPTPTATPKPVKGPMITPNPVRHPFHRHNPGNGPTAKFIEVGGKYYEHMADDEEGPAFKLLPSGFWDQEPKGLDHLDGSSMYLDTTKTWTETTKRGKKLTGQQYYRIQS